MKAINATFVTAGDAIFTVETSAAAQEAGYAAHYTYRVKRVDMKASGKYPARTAYFVSTLNGPDNTSDYIYTGELDAATGSVKLTAKSAFPSTAKRFQVLCRTLARVWKGELDAITAAGWNVKHAGRCCKCGRLLTVPESVDAGIGPECVKSVTGMKLSQYIAEIS